MKVFITPEVHAQIKYFVDKSNIEISGLGRIERDSNNNMVVTKVYLLKQENGATSTDICEQAAAQLMYETREDKGSLNFWWHSHVNMGTFWSTTDMDTIKQFGKNGFLLSTVFNKKGEFRTSYFQGGTDFLPSLFIDQIPTEFSFIPSIEQTKEWEKEYEEKCKPKTYSFPGHTASNTVHSRFGRRWNYTTGQWEDLTHTPPSNATGLGYDPYYNDWDGDDDFIPRDNRTVGEVVADSLKAKETWWWVNGKAIFAGMNCEGLDSEQLARLKEIEGKALEEMQTELAVYKSDDYTTDPVDGGLEVGEFVGHLTGLTPKAIIFALKKIFYHHPVPLFNDLTPTEQAMVVDTYRMTDPDGNEGQYQHPNTKELTGYYEWMMKNYSNLMEVEFDLLEAAKEFDEKMFESVS
jgi:hypothetical protein